MAQDGGSASARLWAMAHLGTPMAIRVAATLCVADHLAGGRRSAAYLATAVHADPDALERLLRYLAARGVLHRDEDGAYALTPLGQPLRSDHPTSLRPGLDIEGVGRADLAFVQLLHSVRTGEPGFPLQYGRPFWEDLASDQARRETFTRWMGSDVPARSAGILSGYPWDSLGHVVDVGGGSGALLIALLSGYPDMKGTLVDLPGTAADARTAVAVAGMFDRCEVVDGSFFDELPAGADGYLLSLVLHNCGDAAATAILRRCAEAADPDGAVLVLERTGPDGTAAHTGMDLRMLTLYGGKERGIGDITALATKAGLTVVAVHPAGAFSILELRRQPVS